jgi:hypothetical protein
MDPVYISVGIVTGWGIGVQSRKKAFLHSVNIGFGALPASYSMDTEGSFPRSKASGA